MTISDKAKATWKAIRKVFKTILRFMNLLEPDVPYMVLSLSKVSVWMTLGLTIYVVTSGKGLAEVGGALLSNVGSIANYAYRRKVQVDTGTGAYAGITANGSGAGEVDPFANAMPTADIPTEEEPT